MGRHKSGSVNDWAAEAAEKIVDEVSESVEWRNRRLVKPSAKRIAAIIATYAQPLVTLVLETRKMHHHEDDSRKCCPRCSCKSWESVSQEHDDGNLDVEPTPNSDNSCTCGADEWNARIEREP